MTIVDSDVLIDFLDGDQDAGDAIHKRMEYADLATTIINQYELFRGADSAAQEDAVERLLANFEVYELDYASMKNASRMFQVLKKSGEIIPEADILIAGIVQSHGEALLTRDRHFEKIRTIKIEII